jgi:hypothetical protein
VERFHYVIRARGEQRWYARAGEFTNSIEDARVCTEAEARGMLRILPIAVDADEYEPWWTGRKNRLMAEAEARAALHLLDELAAYVLDGEPCPERCHAEECEDGIHKVPSDEARADFAFFVERARGLRSA